MKLSILSSSFASWIEVWCKANFQVIPSIFPSILARPTSPLHSALPLPADAEEATGFVC